MFDGLKEKILRESIFYERLRTLLYLSMLKNLKIWIVLQKPKEYIDSAKVVSGVVDGIVNGTAPEPFYKTYIGGKVYFKSEDKDKSDKAYNMEEIVAVSYYPINNIKQDIKSKNVLNNIQHLDPFTGFAKSSDTNEFHYYKTLSDLFGGL